MPKVNLVILTTNCLPGLLLGTYGSEMKSEEGAVLPWKERLRPAVPLLPQAGRQRLLPGTLGAPVCPSPLCPQCLDGWSWGSFYYPVCPLVFWLRMLRAALGSHVSYSSVYLPRTCHSEGRWYPPLLSVHSSGAHPAVRTQSKPQAFRASVRVSPI